MLSQPRQRVSVHRPFGRANVDMAMAVNEATVLFNAGRTGEALRLVKAKQVPVSVIERVLLRKGRFRKSAS
ncbi:MAG TPA: hypothetical protein PKD73_12730 [Burkholderiaceae bacterium]|nr:hypothetical protein [Burkholderiaceae bacterium]